MVRFGFDPCLVRAFRGLDDVEFSKARLLCSACGLSGFLGDPLVNMAAVSRFLCSIACAQVVGSSVSLGFPLIGLVPLPWLWVIL